MMKKIKNQQGFTLIELIIVIAVIAILAAVLLPRFLGFTDDAKMSAAKADAKNLATAVEAIIAQNKTFEATEGGVNSRYSPGEVMNYVGKTLGGNLALTLNGSNIVTSFTYTKPNGGKDYPVIYTVADGSISPQAIVDPSVATPTAIVTTAP